MSKACQNCSKRQNVVINKKLYCANCGEPIYQTAPKPQSKSPKNTKPPKSHLLDLTHESTKAARSAQSVHGSGTVAHKSSARAVKQTAPASRAPEHQTRAQRAQAIKRHPQIRHFHQPATTTDTVKPIAHKPVKAMSPHQTYQVTGSPTPEPKKSHQSRPSRSARWRKQSAQLRDNIKFLGRRRQLAPALAIVAICLVLAAYITYLNVPSIAVRIAASRAGIDAQLPNYRPPGYGFGGLINYSKGQLTVRFNDDQSRSYVDLTQRRSQWDPQTLLENYVTPKSANFIPFNQNGLTIYIYDGNKAAWINNGFFYTLEGDNRLSQDQILKMAASL